MEFWSRLKCAFATFRYYASGSSIHGLLHAMQTISLPRQVSWLIFGVCCFSVGLYHLIITANKFMNPPVLAQLKARHELADFPLVTLCRLKPVSESLFSQRCVSDYILEQWNFFGNWLTEIQELILEGPTQEAFEKFRQKLVLLYQIMWVSGDTRDLGLHDDTMLLHCNFNGVECDHQHFSLLQSSRYWNCYTFDHRLLKNSTTAKPVRFDQLDMTIFTDLYGYNDAHESTSATYSKCLAALQKHRSSTNRDFFQCMSYFCPNTILQNQNFDSGNLRVFFHEPNEYPLSSKDFIDIASARSSTITLYSLHRKLRPRDDYACQEPPFEQVKYARYFGVDLNDTKNLAFNKTEAEYGFEAKQKFVFDKCQCYSHRYPYDSNIRSKLCFYIPSDQWKSLSDHLSRKIKCHEEATKIIDQNTTELAKAFKKFTPCSHRRYRPTMLSVRWPKFEYIWNIWLDLFMPKILGAIEFTPADNKKHHIYKQHCLNFSMFHTREDYQFLSLITSTEKCRTYLESVQNRSFPERHIDRLGWCIKLKHLAKNMAQVRIKKPYAMGDVYEETNSFDWTEALSEIGGTLGLYIGVSLMAAIEMVEIFVAVIVSFVKKEKLGEVRGNRFSIAISIKSKLNSE